MGWKDTSRVEGAGADRDPIRNRGQVMVWLPDNGRGDCSAPGVQGPRPDADGIGEGPTVDEGESSGS